MIAGDAFGAFCCAGSMISSNTTLHDNTNSRVDRLIRLVEVCLAAECVDMADGRRIANEELMWCLHPLIGCCWRAALDVRCCRYRIVPVGRWQASSEEQGSCHPTNHTDSPLSHSICDDDMSNLSPVVSDASPRAPSICLR